eukprot:g1565.t1
MQHFELLEEMDHSRFDDEDFSSLPEVEDESVKVDDPKTMTLTKVGSGDGKIRRIREPQRSEDTWLEGYEGEFEEAQAELLKFYRKRIMSFEEEREDLNRRLNEMEISTRELHKVEWDLRIRREEVAELQRALSDSHVYLHDERQLVLKMQAEMDRLKVQQLEDRQRIQQLLALSSGGRKAGSKSEVTYFENCAVSSSNTNNEASNSLKYSNGSSTTRSIASKSKLLNSMPTSRDYVLAATREGKGAEKGKGRGKLSREPKPRGKGFNRPNEELDALRAHVASLQKQLKDERAEYAETVAALKEDRRVLMEEERVRVKQEQDASAEQQKRREEADMKVIAITKDYLTLRHNAQVQQRMAREEISQVRSVNKRLVTEICAVRADAQAENAEIRRNATVEADQYSAFFRAQAEARERDLLSLKDKYATMVQKTGEKEKRLKGTIKHLKRQYQKLQRRRSMDLEGHRVDLFNLRKQLADLEKVWFSKTAHAPKLVKKRRKIASNRIMRPDDVERGLYHSLERAWLRTNGLLKKKHRKRNKKEMIEKSQIESIDEESVNSVEEFEKSRGDVEPEWESFRHNTTNATATENVNNSNVNR